MNTTLFKVMNCDDDSGVGLTLLGSFSMNILAGPQNDIEHFDIHYIYKLSFAIKFDGG